MKSITLKKREIPLIYTVLEMKTLQEEIGPLSDLRFIITGANKEDENDTSEYGWPHFRAKDFTPAVLKELQQAGIYVLPYVDDRLWNTQDGPNHSDWKYSSEGLKYAVKNWDGSVLKTQTVNYGGSATAPSNPTTGMIWLKKKV